MLEPNRDLAILVALLEERLATLLKRFDDLPQAFVRRSEWEVQQGPIKFVWGIVKIAIGAAVGAGVAMLLKG